MIVVFDTNVWISDLALNSNVGSAIRFYLRERGASIALPEVVKLETEFHLRSTLNTHIEDIQSNHRSLLALFGKLKEVVLPAPDEVEALIGRVFSNLGVEIRDIPFTLESARASLIRTVQKRSPSDKSQQFKDGVLWEDCLRLLQKESVFVVTEDRAFYKNRDSKLGLADELRSDLNGCPNELKLFPSLRDLLSEIGTTVQVDPAVLTNAYMSLHGERVRTMVGKHSFVLQGEPITQMDLFVTEKSSILYVSFAIEFACSDASNEGRSGAKIVVRGEGTYDADAKKFVELDTRGEQLLYQLKDGTEKKLENVIFVVGAIALGHRTVEHSVRYKL